MSEAFDRFGRSAVAGAREVVASMASMDSAIFFYGTVANKLIELGAKGDISKGDISK